MIRKWLKINSYFAEILKSANAPKNAEQRWVCDFSCKGLPSSYSLYGSSNSSSVTSIQSSGSIIRFIHPFSERNDRGDAWSQCSESDDEDSDAPARTDLFEMGGPKGSAFLIEVHAEDLEEVRGELVRLKGDAFRFDKTVIGWFVMKCILVTEPPPNSKRDQARLAKIHAISCGSDEAYKSKDKYLFVNSITEARRAKRMLKKFGYEISGILYRLQPKERINLDDELREVCMDFVKAVKCLPKVLSVTHNL